MGAGLTSGIVISYFPELPQFYKVGTLVDDASGILLQVALNKALPKLGISPTSKGSGVSGAHLASPKLCCVPQLTRIALVVVTVNPPVLLGPADGNGLLVSVTLLFASTGSAAAQGAFLATTLSSVALFVAGDNVLSLLFVPLARATCEIVCGASSGCVSSCLAAHIEVVPPILTIDMACPSTSSPPSKDKKSVNEEEETEKEKNTNDVKQEEVQNAEQPDVRARPGSSSPPLAATRLTLMRAVPSGGGGRAAGRVHG